jgi:hypothetical protein
MFTSSADEFREPKAKALDSFIFKRVPVARPCYRISPWLREYPLGLKSERDVTRLCYHGSLRFPMSNPARDMFVVPTELLDHTAHSLA